MPIGALSDAYPFDAPSRCQHHQYPLFAVLVHGSYINGWIVGISCFHGFNSFGEMVLANLQDQCQAEVENRCEFAEAEIGTG